MLKRFKMALSELELASYMEQNGYDADYAVHSLKQELEMNLDALGGAQPNERGLHLLVRWYNFQWKVVLVWFVLTGRRNDIVTEGF